MGALALPRCKGYRRLVVRDGKGGEAHNLTTLTEVSMALSSTLELKHALRRVLERLERRHAVLRSAVVLLESAGAAGGELAIEAALGITTEGQRARYRVGEGITGRVVASGKTIVVPRVSEEPLFLHRAVQRKKLKGPEITFICVPIHLGGTCVGALAVDLAFHEQRDYEATARFLGVVAAMIAQGLKMHRMIEGERRRLVDENIHLRQELTERYDVANLLGTSGAMRQVHEAVAQVAGTNTTVLIRGESGTGKELIAHAIHYASKRAKKPFVKVNVAALPGTLVESELFGYEKGAFTGAANRKKGRFEMADGGTLFLDEIGELDLSTQVKLLRVLQEREFERLGGTESVKVNVRLVAATNKDLEEALGAGTFREDLFYRLNVFTVFVPPLRERKSDIMLLAEHFLAKYADEHGKSIQRISTPAIDMLVSYHWPGNVRELENTIERAVLVSEGNVIHGHHLPPTLQTAEASGTLGSASLEESVSQFEKDLLVDALKTTRGNRSKAARLLQSTERIVAYKVRKYGIDPARFAS